MNNLIITIFGILLFFYISIYSSNKLSSGFGVGPLYGVNLDENINNVVGLDISYTTEIIGNMPIHISTISLVPRLFLGETSNNYGLDLEFTTYL